MPDNKIATKQATENRRRKPSPINGQVLPPGFEAHPERRHNGAWKKEDTLRYKWEQILKMDNDELKEILKDKKIGRVEKMTAEVLLDKQMKATEKIQVLDRLATQVYGYPKQSVETTVLEPPKPLSPRKQKNDKK